MATQKEILTRIGVASLALAAIALTIYFCRQTTTPPHGPEATATARIIITATPHETSTARPTSTQLALATATEVGLATGFFDEDENEIVIPPENHPNKLLPNLCVDFINRSSFHQKGWQGRWSGDLCLGFDEYYNHDIGGGQYDKVFDGPSLRK